MAYLSTFTQRLVTRLALLVFCGLFVSCTLPEEVTAPGQTDIEVAAVRVLPESSFVVVGSRFRLSADVRDTKGRALQDEPILWASTDTAIAAIDSLGDVRVLQAGQTEFTATVKGKRGRSHLVSGPVPVATVEVSPSQGTVQSGAALQLTARTLDAAAAALVGRVVVWSTSNPSVASVDATGRVQSLALGTVTITAASEGQLGFSTLAVVAPPPPPAPGTVTDLNAISATDTTATMQFTEVGDGAGAAANYLIRYAPNSILWSSAQNVARGSCISPISGTTVGAVRTCVIRGLSPSTSYRFQVVAYRGTIGSAEVYGALSNVASATTAQATVASVTVAPTSFSVFIGATQALTAVVRDGAGNVLAGRTIAWSSTATGVATVTSAGVVTGVSAGTGAIRATTGGITGTATMTVAVRPPASVASVTMVPNSLTLVAGSSATIAATLRDSAGVALTGRTIAWSSTATSVITVAANGQVTAVAPGTASIRATSEGVTGSAGVVVTDDPIPAQLQISTQPTSTSAGVSIAPAPIVRVLNAAGRLVGNGIQVTATKASGTGTLGGTTTVATVAGVATFSDLRFVTGSGPHTVQMAATGVTAVTSAEFSVTAAPDPIVYFRDDFESGALGGSGLPGFGWAESNGFAGSAPGVSAVLAVSGSRSLAFPYTAAADGSDGWSEQRFIFGSNLTEVYLRWSWFVPSNYVHRSQSSTTNNKFLRLWTDQSYQSTHMQLGFEMGEETDSPYSYIYPQKQNIETSMTQSAREVGRFITAADLGTWMRIQVFARVDNGSGNARVQLWKNGTLIVDTGNFRNPTGTGPNFLKQGYLMGWANSGFAAATTFRIDDFEVANFSQP